MAATVRGAIRELMEQTMATMDALLEASDRELAAPSSHACAQGKDVPLLRHLARMGRASPLVADATRFVYSLARWLAH